MFILSSDINSIDPTDFDAFKAAYRRYHDYLLENKSRFPAATFDLAISQVLESGCDPHLIKSSRVEEFEIRTTTAENDVIVDVSLVGPLEDAYGVLSYKGVIQSSVFVPTQEDHAVRIYRSEFTIDKESGAVHHQVEFADGKTWSFIARKIECTSRRRIGTRGKRSRLDGAAKPGTSA